LQSKLIALFALVDHSGEAQKVGMKMPATKLLIFGSPKAGTPLMLAAPSSAIDLLLKCCFRRTVNEGRFRTTVHAIRNRGPDFPEELLSNIAPIEALAMKAAE